MEEYELVVRKTISSFIEKIVRYCGYDIPHDSYKEVIYNEKACETETEEQIKSYYDGYMYLLSNTKNILSQSVLKKFFYIIYKQEMNENFISQIVSKNFYLNEYSPIEKPIELHIYVRRLMDNYKQLDKMLIPLMILNYVLVSNNIGSIKLVRKEIIEYQQIVEDKNKLYIFFTKLIKEYKFIPKTYIKNLRKITLNEVIENLINEKNELIEKYQVKNLILHGSFVKEKQRIDSDIDMLVRLNMNMTYKQREEKLKELKLYLTNKFNRFVDLEEINTYLDEEFIKELKEIKIII